MNPELKAKWIAALRSGKYAQTRWTLHDGVGFCCLGVLCEISDLGEWDGSTYRFSDGGTVSGGLAGDQHFSLTNRVDSICMDLNDGGTPFPEIADHIEQRTDI